jgi:hypothetical protein
MQAVKPEWSDLQAQFTPLALDAQLSHIVEELKALQSEIEADGDVAFSNASEESFGERSSLIGYRNLMLRKIQRYVEWTVPELLPERVEDAEILVNVARFAARLLIQEKAENTSGITSQIEQLLNQLSFVQNVD